MNFQHYPDARITCVTHFDERILRAFRWRASDRFTSLIGYGAARCYSSLFAETVFARANVGQA